MARKLLLAANWKMHKTAKEAAAYVKDLLPRVEDFSAVELALCPPFTAMDALHTALQGSSVTVGAQDVFWEPKGAFTGEISAAMLKEFKVQYVIVGHSERRQYFDERDAGIAKKLAAALAAGITPILCVGESMMQRKGGKEKAFVQSQLQAALKEFHAAEVAKMVIAYEPLWAIGSGTPATPKQAQEMHAAIRQWLAKQYNSSTAAAVRTLYGGSANADNCRDFFVQPDIDGALVGGASLDSAVFARMAEIAEGVGKRKSR